jgi:hypothetical protein
VLRLHRCLPWIAAGLLALAAHAGAAPAISYHEPLTSLTMELAPGALSDATGTQLSGMRFEAFGREFDVSLQHNDRLLASLDSQRRARLGDLALYRGTLQGLAGSWVRVSILHGEVHGLIWDGTELYVIEPAAAVTHMLAHPDAAPGRGLVIFRWRDFDGGFRDEVIEPGVIGRSSYDALIAMLRSETEAGGNTQRVTIGLVGDVEFALAHADPEGEMLARINIVDGIFLDQVNLLINVADVVSYTSEPDPFDPRDAEDLLGVLADYRADTPALRSLGLVHLFTGRLLAGETGDGSQIAGIAYLGTVCDSRLGVSLTQWQSTPAVDAVFVAHELGHNLGAPHDAEPGSPCADAPPGYLMDPAPNGTQFSECSLAQMAPVIASASCITTLPSGDIGVSIVAPPKLLLGDEARITVQLDNAGAETVYGIHLNLALTPGLEISAFDPPPAAGSCEWFAEGLDCVIDSVDGTTSLEIPVTVKATALGTPTLTAAADSGNDANAANDSASLSIQIDRAVTLSAQFNPDLFLSKSSTASSFVGFENVGAIAATHLVVSLSSDFPLQWVTAAPGNCDFDPDQPLRATCTIATLDVSRWTNVSFTVGPPDDLGANEHRDGTLTMTATASEPMSDASQSKVTFHLAAYGKMANLALEIREWPGSFDVSETPHVRAAIRNDGPDAAPSTATFTFPAFFTITNVVSTLGSCSTDADPGVLVCESESMASSTSASIEFDIASTLGGTYTWQAEVSGPLFDDNDADNVLSYPITVTGAPPPPPPPPPPDDGGSGGSPRGGGSDGGGGGGESSMLIVAALVGLIARRRQWS